MTDERRSTTISTRITPELKQRLQTFADQRCVGVVLVVERALSEYLDSAGADPERKP